ncbi:MAG: Mor transcription activator family protein [Candidatus Edwardsbacteria bacterium]|nr:Mor transcription activator family protein [Candidatus Edwardsbacteria bacterium]
MSKGILKEVIGDVKLEDMPNGDMKMVAEYCGVDTAVQLMSQMGGLTIYIPTGIYKAKVEQYVRRNWRKIETKRLALACNVSEKYVYNLIRRAKEDEAQLKIFPK